MLVNPGGILSSEGGKKGCAASPESGGSTGLAVLAGVWLLWLGRRRLQGKVRNRTGVSTTLSVFVLLVVTASACENEAQEPGGEQDATADSGAGRCEEVFGYDFDEAGQCLTSKEPTLVGCFGTEEGFNDFCEMVWTCYLSPDHETVVVADCHGGPEMMLRTEGWTQECPSLEESLGEPYLPLCEQGR